MKKTKRAVSWGSFVLLLLIVVVPAAVFPACGVRMSLLSKDPSQITHTPFYYGLLSHIGVLLWFASGTVCLFASRVIIVNWGS